jgi:hypothetical protein
MPAEKFLTVDIGRAWTKAFLVALDSENRLDVEKTLRLPTSHGDLSLVVKNLISNLTQEAQTPKIFVSRLDRVENVAKKWSGEFIHEDASGRALTEFFKKSDSRVTILDAGASNLETNIETHEIGKYLSFAINEIGLENFLGNKKFRPHMVPLNVKELEIEEAFFRNLFKSSMENAPDKKKLLVVATGGIFSGTPNIYRLAILLLDILVTGQLAQVYFDREFFLPSFGALLSKYKQLQVVSTGGWLDNLGAFASLGAERKVDLNWGYSTVQKVELTGDEIALVPAPGNQDIKVEFTMDKEKRTHSVLGGSMGILMDARSKPLQLAFGQGSSRDKIRSWLKQVEESRRAEEAF